MKPGDLVKDMTDGEIGLVMGISPEWTPEGSAYLVKFPSYRALIEIPSWSETAGWVKIISKA